MLDVPRRSVETCRVVSVISSIVSNHLLSYSHQLCQRPYGLVRDELILHDRESGCDCACCKVGRQGIETHGEEDRIASRRRPVQRISWVSRRLRETKDTISIEHGRTSWRAMQFML